MSVDIVILFVTHHILKQSVQYDAQAITPTYYIAVEKEKVKRRALCRGLPISIDIGK